MVATPRQRDANQLHPAPETPHRGGQLNSFHDISDPTNISYGNPELRPQYSNAFELNYIKSWTFHMVSLSAYVRTSTDMMNRISYLDNDVMYTHGQCGRPG